MRKNWLLLGIVLLIAVLAIGAVACGDDDDDASTATEAADGPIGLPSGVTNTVIVSAGVLADSAGNTLYVFDNDEAGVSNCADECAVTWPPLTVDGDAIAGDGVGTLATITRDDGTTQVTHDDQPLYYYSRDTGVGDQAGDGVGDVWHIVPGDEKGSPTDQ